MLWKRFRKSGIMLFLSVSILFTGFGEATAQNKSPLKDKTLLSQALSEQTISDEKLMSINFTKVTLEKALEILADRLKVGFSYNPDLMPNKFVSFEMSNVQAYEIIYKLLEGTNLEPVLPPSRDVIILREKENVEILPEIYQETITGTVVDAETGEALPGVNVIVMGSAEETGSMIGTTTNVDGEFELSVTTLEETLVFSYIGYERLVVDIAGRTELNIQLMPDVQMLEDLVVVGYGVQEEISVTNSISQITNEEITRRPVVDTEQSLQGIASGLTIIDSGGRPGDRNLNLRVRGITTLNENQPLIIVDGIEQSLSNIDPSNIENISVLKDASSTAIYGSRAANGVILVTTKRGTSGISVNYNGYMGIEDAINRPKHMNLEDYLRLENIAHENAGRQIPYSEEFIQEYISNAPSPDYPLPYPYFRRDELGILDPALHQSHSLSIQGGNETITTRASFRRQDVGGILPNFKYTVNDLRVNTDINITNDFKTRIDLKLRNSTDVLPAIREGAIYQFMIHGSRFITPKYEDGSYGLPARLNNPLIMASESGKHTTDNNELTANVRADYEIIPSLNFSTQFAVRYLPTKSTDFSRSYRFEDPFNGRVLEQSLNSLTEQRSSSFETTFNSTMNYTQNFSQHGVKVLGGYSMVQNNGEFISTYRQGFYNNDIQSMSAGSNDIIRADGRNTEWAIMSYFARLNYDYDKKYLLELNGRYDGSSRFSEGNRYGFFPSGSVGWRISTEPFWNRFRNYINEFKLRASYGSTGNQEVGLYSYIGSLNSIDYSFNGEPVQAFAQTDLANTDITWETTTQTNFGLDMGVLDDRLRLQFDYYKKVTDDILLQLPIPRVIGLGAPPQNAGTVHNEGYEVSIRYRGGNQLEYSLGLNFSSNRNEVVDLAGAGPFINGGIYGVRTIIKEGLPINAHWGYKTDGFFQSQQEIDNSVTINSNVAPGDVKFVDLDGDGDIDQDDHTYLGRSFPKYDFGFNADFFYKNFGLHMQWQGAAGHKKRLEGGFQQIATFGTFTHAIYTDNYWTPENTDARFARPVKGDRTNLQTSDYLMIDNDYIRLKNLQLSYNIPPTGRLGFVNDLRVYVSATNLLTFSELNEWNVDPEIPSGRGISYPHTSTYTLGLNLSF